MSDGMRVYYQSTAPGASDGALIGNLWVDTSVTPPIVKKCTATDPAYTWASIEGGSGGSVTFAAPVDLDADGGATGSATTVPHSDHEHDVKLAQKNVDSSTPPVTGQVLGYNGTKWAPTNRSTTLVAGAQLETFPAASYVASLGQGLTETLPAATYDASLGQGFTETFPAATYSLAVA